MDFILGSGAKLTVTESSFEDAIELNDALINSLGDIKLTDDMLNVDIDPANPLGSFTGASNLFSLLANKIKSLAASSLVRACIFKCGNRASYNGIRVSKDLFDDPQMGFQARQDYYDILIKIVEVNCRPFLENLISMLKIKRLMSTDTQKQKQSVTRNG
jgi:hypothetical protein